MNRRNSICQSSRFLPLGLTTLVVSRGVKYTSVRKSHSLDWWSFVMWPLESKSDTLKLQPDLLSHKFKPNNVSTYQFQCNSQIGFSQVLQRVKILPELEESGSRKLGVGSLFVLASPGQQQHLLPQHKGWGTMGGCYPHPHPQLAFISDALRKNR